MAHQSSAVIEEAQASSADGANPKWLEFSNQRDLFRRVRNRAYACCLSDAKMKAKCAAEQDGAVQSAVMALMVADAQRHMPRKEKLGRKEYWVASNPDVAAHVASYCWALYKEHGASDARILSVCLGNLTEYSPLVDLPVP